MHTTFSETRRNQHTMGICTFLRNSEKLRGTRGTTFSETRRNSIALWTPLSQKLGETQLHYGHHFLRNSEKLNCIMDTTFTRHLVKLLFIHFWPSDLQLFHLDDEAAVGPDAQVGEATSLDFRITKSNLPYLIFKYMNSIWI